MPTDGDPPAARRIGIAVVAAPSRGRRRGGGDLVPSVVATTCPGCYGLERLRPGVYAEPGLTAAQRRHVIEVVDQADARVRDFFGGRTTSPDVLVCLSDDCYRRIGGGGERGVAVLNRAVMLSPRGADPVIASHELTHVGAARPPRRGRGPPVVRRGPGRPGQRRPPLSRPGRGPLPGRAPPADAGHARRLAAGGLGGSPGVRPGRLPGQPLDGGQRRRTDRRRTAGGGTGPPRYQVSWACRRLHSWMKRAAAAALRELRDHRDLLPRAGPPGDVGREGDEVGVGDGDALSRRGAAARAAWRAACATPRGARPARPGR